MEKRMTREEQLLNNLRGHLSKYEMGDDKYHWDIMDCLHTDAVTGWIKIKPNHLEELKKEFPISFKKLDLEGVDNTNWIHEENN